MILNRQTDKHSLAQATSIITLRFMLASRDAMKEIIQNGYSSWFSGIFNAQGLLVIKELAWNFCWKSRPGSVNWPTVGMLNWAFWCGMPALLPCWHAGVWASVMLGIVGYWPAAAMTPRLYQTSEWQGCWFLAMVGDISRKNLQNLNTASLDASSENINTFFGNVC